MSTRTTAEEDRLIQALRTEFWSELNAQGACSPMTDPLEKRPGWHAAVSRLGGWGVVLVGMQALAAVSAGAFCEKSGVVAAAETASAPVFLAFLLLNGTGLLLLPKSAGRRGALVFFSALAGCAMWMCTIHPSWSGAWNLAELVTGLPGSTP